MNSRTQESIATRLEQQSNHGETLAIAAPQTRTSPEVSPVAIGDLLREDLRIPHYQRPYTWEAPMALQLLDDTLDAHHGAVGSRAYVLGAVVLHDGGDGLDVVDGQQRLLTLRMLLGLLAASRRSTCLRTARPL